MQEDTHYGFGTVKSGNSEESDLEAMDDVKYEVSKFCLPMSYHDLKAGRDPERPVSNVNYLTLIS